MWPWFLWQMYFNNSDRELPRSGASCPCVRVHCQLVPSRQSVPEYKRFHKCHLGFGASWPCHKPPIQKRVEAADKNQASWQDFN